MEGQQPTWNEETGVADFLTIILGSAYKDHIPAQAKILTDQLILNVASLRKVSNWDAQEKEKGLARGIIDAIQEALKKGLFILLFTVVFAIFLSLCFYSLDKTAA